MDVKSSSHCSFFSIPFHFITVAVAHFHLDFGHEQLLHDGLEFVDVGDTRRPNDVDQIEVLLCHNVVLRIVLKGERGWEETQEDRMMSIR